MYPTADVLLPTWWRAVWVVLLVGVVIVLALAASRATGRPRVWHAVYAGAAACMVVMYAANPMDTPGFNGPALTVFVIAAVGLVAVVVTGFRGGVTAPWVVAAVDVLTLAYIQIPADVRPVIVCVLVACYLAVQVALRLTVAVRALRGAPQRASRALVDPSGRPASDGPAVPATTRIDAVVPIALAVLALGMLYMLSV